MTDSYDHELVFVQPTKRSPSSREKIAQAVNTSNILGVLGESHARLRPSAPWIEGRGWLEFSGYRWSYFSKPPHDYAVWQRDDVSAPSWSFPRVSIWFTGLTAGARYTAAIEVSASPYATETVSYELRGSGSAPSSATGSGGRTLLVACEPDSSLSLISLEARGVGSLLFFQAEIFRMGD